MTGTLVVPLASIYKKQLYAIVQAVSIENENLVEVEDTLRDWTEISAELLEI